MSPRAGSEVKVTRCAYLKYNEAKEKNCDKIPPRAVGSAVCLAFVQLPALTLVGSGMLIGS